MILGQIALRSFAATLIFSAASVELARASPEDHRACAPGQAANNIRIAACTRIMGDKRESANNRGLAASFRKRCSAATYRMTR